VKEGGKALSTEKDEKKSSCGSNRSGYRVGPGVLMGETGREGHCSKEKDRNQKKRGF